MAMVRSYLPSLARRKAECHEGDYLKGPDAAAVSGSFTDALSCVHLSA